MLLPQIANIKQTQKKRERGEILRERVKERWVSAGVQEGPCHLSYIKLRNELNI